MRIAVVNPRGYLDSPEKWMPLGAVTVATVLRAEGHNVRLHDEETFPAGYTAEEIGSILEWADVLCLSGMSHQVAGIHRWISDGLSAGVKVVVGGIHASLCARPADEFLGTTVVCGPGEEQVLNALQVGPGIVIRSEPLKDLDKHPWPSREGFGWSRYREMVEGIPAIRVVGSRGCPFSCKYCCNKRLSGRKLALRSPYDVADEISGAMKALGIRAVVFAMADFTIDKQWARDMCKELRQLGVLWKATTRVDLIDLETIRRMKIANCIGLGFGVESGDDDVLRILGKGTTCARARKAFDMCARVGLPSWAMFMTHVPGETPDTLARTKQFARELDPPLGCTFQRFSPLPGSAFWDEIGKWGVVAGRKGRGFGPVSFTPHAFVGKE